MFRCGKKQSKKQSEVETEHIVFVNKPIKSDVDEILGYTAQSKLINAAIKDGANIIGIVADYGTGKSSLTELLCLETNSYPKSVIKINLWDTLSQYSEEPSKGNNSADISNLTKSFIFQLANGATKKKGLSKYVSKRMSKNYGFLSLSPINICRFICIIIIAFACYAFPIAIKDTFTQIPVLIDLLLNIISPWVAIAIAVIGIIRNNIVFSMWDSQGKNTPEESDTFSLFCEVVEELFKLEKIKNGKKLIVVVEDLDRIKNKNVVLNFLKEIYKYNNLLTKNYKSDIVFIVSVMPEESLIIQAKSDEFGQNIYSKIFDYSINLQSIHYDDYSQVALDLLKSKKILIEKTADITISDSLPPEFSWIIKGDHLTLRDIKNRLNNCFSLYERLKLRENEHKNLKISIEKCVAVSYLQDNYPKDMAKLCKEEEAFANIVTRAVVRKNKNARGDMLDSDNISFKNGIGNTIVENGISKNTNFNNDIAELLLSEIISDDFKMYFYTYPKEGIILSSEETTVKQILNNDQAKLNAEEKELIDRLLASSPELIISWCQELINQKLGLPTTIFDNEMLFKLCCKRMFKDTVTKILDELNWTPHHRVSSENTLAYIKSCQPDEYTDLIKSVSDRLYLQFSKLDVADVSESRTSIIRALGDDIILLKKLYFKDLMPIITDDEIALIENKEVLLELINSALITQESSEYIGNALMVEYDLERQKEVVEILKICLKVDTSNVSFCLNFMNINKIHNQELFDIALTTKSYDNSSIVSYLNNSDLKTFGISCFASVNKFKIFGNFSHGILDKLFEGGLYYSYLFSVDVEQLDFTTFNYPALSDTLIEIFNDDTELFMLIRKCLPVDFYNNYDFFFEEEYPFITSLELRKINTLSEALNLIDLKKIKSETQITILSDYFNDFYKSASDCYDILESILKSDEIEDEIKNKFFFSLDFTKLQYKNMSKENIDKILEILQNIIALSNAEDILQYMEHTEFLDETLEKTILDELRRDSNIKSKADYFNLVSRLKQFTETTLKIVRTNYFDVPMWEEFEKATEENNDNISACISKTLRTQSFEFNCDEKYLSPKDYIGVFNHCINVKILMKQNIDFLQYLIRSDAVEEIQHDDLNLFIKLRQPIGFIKHVFDTLTDSESKIQYIFEMEDLDTPEDSKAFLEFMSASENLELLSDNKELKNKVSFRLYNHGERIKYGNRVIAYFNANK